MARSRQRSSGAPRGFDRTDRLNELLTRLLAEELERIDDVRLDLVTVMGVDTDRDLSQAKVYVTGGAADDEVIEFPITTHNESLKFAHDLLAEHAPSALISIERAGLVGDGTYRNWKGLDFSEHNAKIDHMFEQHPYSVGIGDGGNEIGMGNMRHVIPDIENLPDDPCTTTTTELIIASVSNWGGYGLVAALSVKSDKNLLPSVEQGDKWVRDIVAVGAVEGVSGESKDWVDGRAPEDDAMCLRDLHTLLTKEGL
jgi:ribosome-binding factor A